MEDHVKAQAKKVAYELPVGKEAALQARGAAIAKLAEEGQSFIADLIPKDDPYFAKKVAALAQGLTRDPEYQKLEKEAAKYGPLKGHMGDSEIDRKAVAAFTAKAEFIEKAAKELGLPQAGAFEANRLLTQSEPQQASSALPKHGKGHGHQR